MRFRATDRSAPVVAAALLCLCSGVDVVGCEKTTGGTAVRTGQSSAPTLSDPAEPVPGIETTLRQQIPHDSMVCFPQPPFTGRLAMASIVDPVAPKVMLHLPDGWNSARGTGEVALTATGPDQMSARVTIAPTRLDPGGAFLRYAADLRTAVPGVAVTVAPAQFCGYSSQLLSGSGSVAFADRITHVWTNSTSYVVAVHVEAPAGAPGFDAAKSTAMQQFAIVIP